jgi:ferredoxin-nitrite reductase
MPPLLRLPDGDARPAAPADTTARAEPSGPDAVHVKAQNRFLTAGKKLTAEEQAKRDKPPFEMWDEVARNAREGKYPKGTDVFLYKFYGLFQTAPAQDGFMSRLKLPNGILRAWQMDGLADLADRYGGGYSHVTTRANLQIREIKAENPVHYLDGLFDLGITSKGSGADNIRNITGSPTAGIDPQELIDTRPLAPRDPALHPQQPLLLRPAAQVQHRLRRRRARRRAGGDERHRPHRLPRARGQGGPGRRLLPPRARRHHRPPGHRPRHGRAGPPEECTPVCAAIIRVFIDEGDRTDRKKARMKYVLDRWGYDRYLAEAERVLGYALPRVPLGDVERRGPIDRMGHVGVHPQRQDGLSYFGVPLPVGRLTTAQMRHLADLARRYGDGEIRLTVWQNLLLPACARPTSRS